MAKWQMVGATSVTFDYNPKRDSGWNYGPLSSKHQPIASNVTLVQEGGFESGDRQVEGITKSASVKTGLEAILTARSVVTLTDHNGVASSVKIMSLVFEEILDASNLGATFGYRMTLMKR